MRSEYGVGQEPLLQPVDFQPYLATREELHGALPPGALLVDFKNWGGFHMVLDCKLIFVS